MKYAALILVIFTSSAFAQDNRDDEIFGTAATPAPSAPAKPAETSLADTLQVGGRLELRTTASKVEDQSFGKGPHAQLRQADVYFDSRPNPGVRAFLRARFTEQTPRPAKATTAVDQSIDELWVKTDWDRAAFFTVGKQHVKWGSGRLWNPTDFTATQSRDPFDLFDRRLGQTMVKLHVPDEKRAFNYYAIALLDGMNRNDDAGAALRAEFALFGTAELSFSYATRRSEPQRLGLDLSTALGPVDVFAEGAAFKRDDRTFYKGTLDPATGQIPTPYTDKAKAFTQIVGGVTKTWKYSDDDNVTLGAEYFQNGQGYEDRNLGIYSLINGQSQPLYVGRKYAGAYVNLPSPGSWNDTSFYVNGIRNLSDKTSTARVTTTWTFHKEATFEAFISRCFGDYGELCLRVPSSYQALAASPLITEAQKQTIAALPVKRTILTAGAGFSMKF